MNTALAKKDKKALAAIATLEPYLEEMNRRASPFGLDPYYCEFLRKLDGLKKVIEAKTSGK